MQTVYLLGKCKKCLRALYHLFKNPDLSTSIIIVNKFQSKILLLDKRVKEFPFIINTQPTNLGLVPKIARVLPLRKFINLGSKKPKSKISYHAPKIHNRYANYQQIVQRPKQNIVRDPRFMLQQKISREIPLQIPQQIPQYFKHKKKKTAPVISKEVQKDGSVNITLQ